MKKKKNILPARVVWSMMCKTSLIDQEKNNVSLIDIIDQFTVEEEAFETVKKSNTPIMVQCEYEIVLLLKRLLNIELSNEEISLDLIITERDPKGVAIQEILGTVQIPANIILFRFRMRLSGCLITIPGEYTYELTVKPSTASMFESAGTIPFAVTSRKKLQS